MSEWAVKRGNTAVLDVFCKDEEGNKITNLSSAEEVKFQVKTKPLDVSAIIAKIKGSGIEVDTPSLGYLRIILLPTDTDIVVKKYSMAVEIIWDGDNKYEVDIEIGGVVTETFRIKQDTIRESV